LHSSGILLQNLFPCNTTSFSTKVFKQFHHSDPPSIMLLCNLLSACFLKTLNGYIQMLLPIPHKLTLSITILIPNGISPHDNTTAQEVMVVEQRALVMLLTRNMILQTHLRTFHPLHHQLPRELRPIYKSRQIHFSCHSQLPVPHQILLRIACHRA